jgi:hypothetical protein
MSIEKQLTENQERQIGISERQVDIAEKQNEILSSHGKQIHAMSISQLQHDDRQSAMGTIYERLSLIDQRQTITDRSLGEVREKLFLVQNDPRERRKMWARKTARLTGFSFAMYIMIQLYDFLVVYTKITSLIGGQ